MDFQAWLLLWFYFIPRIASSASAPPENLFNRETTTGEDQETSSVIPSTTEFTTELFLTEENFIQSDETPGLSEKVDPENSDYEVEHWNLDRRNCNRQINISESRTKNITVDIGAIDKNVEGQCQITVNGPQGAMLALLISDINLKKYNQEILRVVTRSQNVNYVMKEFRQNEALSLLLPDSNPVYLIFYYKSSSSVEQSNTRFNLQIFSYKMQENMVMSELERPVYDIQADEVYFTTGQPQFESNTKY